MHHLPRFLSPREKSAGKAAMDPRKMRQKPRLERRNAAKHIEYDVASTSSSLDDSSSSSSLITRSLDLSDRTSFRIEGVEGEFERICRSLGLSGPEDFAIPAAAWEARKNRSASDLLPRSRLKQLDTLKETVERQSDAAGAVVGELCDRVSDIVRIRNETELTRTKLTQVAELSCRASGAGNNDALAVMETTELPPSGLAESSACCVSSNYVKGIKGVRPPLLKPPPGMRQPVIDNACSTWDILRDFAPKDGITPSSVMNDRALSSSSDDEDNEKEGEEADRAIIKEEEDDMVLSESCSFTTEHEDDSSSTTTEPMSNISPNGRFKRIITYWQKGDLLGRGSFGSVYEGISDDGFFFAVKEVSLLDQGSQAKQSISQLEQEIALLSRFEHENIVQYYGTDKDESKLYIFLELVTKGSLLNLYQRYHLRDSQVSAYTRQILLGLKYLHDQDVVHRDIKCANILVDANGSVKLADFGLAKATKLNDVKSCRGTAFWMAPEVINNKNKGYGLPADIWSLGCTVLEMLTSQIPYAPMECMAALFKIGRGSPPPIPDSLSKDAQDFIKQCVQVNPNDRPTAAQLLDHPFVKRLLATNSGSASPYLGRR